MNKEFQIEACKKTYPWAGKPIWIDRDVFPEYQESRYTYFDDRMEFKYGVAVFEKKVLLKKEVKKIICWVTGDCKYRLYTDKKFAGTGPTIPGGDYGNKSPMDSWYYDRYEVPFSGKTLVLSAEVVLQPIVQAEYSMGQGCLLLDLEIYYSDGTVEVYGTDESWDCGLDMRYEEDGCYDGRKEIVYGKTVVVENRWNLKPKELPNLVHREITASGWKNPFYKERVRFEKNKITVSPGSPVTFWLEFDKTYAAYLLLRAEGCPGVHMEIGTQEILGRTDRREKIITGDGITKYRGMKMQSVHFLNVTLSELVKEFTMELSVDATEYPVTQEGEFQCSDEILNQVYELGKWTLRICRQDYHMDSPIHQETLGCTGDYMIESLINYYTFGDSYLTRMDVLRTRDWLRKNDFRMFHTSYSLMWIQMLKDYYWYTDDGSILEECYPEVKGLLKRFACYIGESGLVVNAPNYMFMDWVAVGEYNLHHPPKVLGIGYMSALYHHALEDGAFIARYLKDYGQEITYKILAKGVKESFQVLWDEERKLYKDGIKTGESAENEWLPEGSGVYYSQHTNTMAVLFGLAEDRDEKLLMEQVMEDTTLIQAQPYFYHFIFEALEKTGLFEKYGNNAMRKWGNLVDECCTGLKEVWEGFDCDYSHAWGATPAFQMPSKVLGIQVTEPGFRKIRFCPQLGDLSYAKGKIPTPFGMLEAEAKKQEEEIICSITKPEEIVLEE